MARLVWVLLLVLAVVALWRGARRRDAVRPSAAPPSPSRRGAAPEAMVRCAHCGLHLAVAEALQDGGLSYCSEAHRLAGPARLR
jgi:uncharacterized protein